MNSDTIKAIICPKTGRLGNQILNIILALSLCLQSNINIIKLPNVPLYYDKDFISINDCELIELNNSNQIYLQNFWEYDFKMFNLEKFGQEIKNILRNKFFFPKIKNYNNNVLHIHIRSGDIMLEGEGSGMVQPPCKYYENEILKKKWDKVIIVAEDKINPCIKYLVEKYDNVSYFGKNSLEEDISELLSATNIMIGRGTFMPILSLFMPHLQKIHYPDDNDKRMHYFIETFNPKKCIKHSQYIKYYNEIEKMGGWNYNERLGNYMLNFSI